MKKQITEQEVIEIAQNRMGGKEKCLEYMEYHFGLDSEIPIDYNPEENCLHIYYANADTIKKNPEIIAWYYFYEKLNGHEIPITITKKDYQDFIFENQLKKFNKNELENLMYLKIQEEKYEECIIIKNQIKTK
jgi:uncharacterized protein YqkB